MRNGTPEINLSVKVTLPLLVSGLAAFPAHADVYTDAAERWLTNEFTESTLSHEQQMDELAWFSQAAAPYRGMTIRVVSERIDTHVYEANVLARAFRDITGINVIHEVTGEDDLVKKIRAQMDTGLNIYDGYINDTDFIGTHFRYGKTVALSDYIQAEGAEVTLPTLDLDDFIGLDFGTGPDGKLYQLPDQQFANLYWYRHDWFSRPDLQRQFETQYGYPLGVPQNWAAYEDIAEFFSHRVQRIDGQRIWGHMDYGRTDPSLGWRVSDAWLSLAGAGDTGLPNGYPVDEWGIRMDGCHPVGASVARGGALNSPAAVYAITKYVEWLEQFAPPQAFELTFTSSGEWIAQGQVAQQVFWYTAFMPALTAPTSRVTGQDGRPLWRVAPSPRGAYWQEGMKSGYQDAGGWTFLKNTPADRLAAAWLYAQFTVSKTVSLQKLLVNLTPIRLSDIESEQFGEQAPYLGGLVEFYRSNARNIWTPTGVNVPDYAALSGYWWQHLSQVLRHQASPEEAMTALARDIDITLEELGNDPDLSCAPQLNPPRPEADWLQVPGAPKPRLTQQPTPVTLPYREAIEQW
ncbi:ABC transporter substrate-binding protein [Marinobacter zhejiangensis]|uniref:Carbohydrate ABC transporter substrate-binding protein, CUT1 family n=1 Tax=Marinobacter zhejiangensis TaxID=488535 RepID=A0A1I4SVJ6_9GAMM|nr:ABC transporter substrate-binding protein [Marinobacter zhejiangensis]SFM68407.1 carbohydrate ABC transporter substrate-binding protein, CUT1 family [Marinobacter zhejiangensis]